MIWILLSILMCAAFGHTMRHAQHCGRNMPWVGAWNYIIAAGVSWTIWIVQGEGQPPLTSFALNMGTIAGVCLVTAYFLMVPCIRIAGVGITQAIAQLSVIIPIIASIFIWRETPGMVRAVGLGLVLVAFPFLGYGRAVPRDSGERSRFWLLLVFFVVEGITGLTMKAYSQRAPGQEIAYMCFMFSVPALINLIAAIRMAPPDRRDLAHGTILGLINAFAGFTFLRALERAPGIVVFPTISIGSILVASLLAMVLWDERYRGKVLWGMAVAVIALILINAAH